MGNQRDIQTLLLCKVNAYNPRNNQDGYFKAYTSLFPQSGNSKAKACRKYITYGNFDAVCIYKTGNAASSEWLKEVERDRKEVTDQISSDICYHPIHMISHNTVEDFWKKAAVFPACLITLVYGAMPQDPTPIDEFIKCCIGNIDERKATYSVYQAINICDAVVLWMTNDINYTLRLSAELTRNGKARKTYSLLGFEMPDFSDLCQSKKELESSLANELSNIRIQGSIRDHSLATALFSNNESSFINQCVAQRRSHPEKVECVCVFGNEDFDIRLQNLNKDQLLDVLFGMLENSNKIASACWDIHTEFIDPEDYSANQIDFEPLNHELDECLKSFKASYREFKKKSIPCPWASAYLELLGTHVNIDHHPILRAPASLFSNFVRIANDYFEKSCNPANRYHTKYQEILKKSEERIYHVIRNWSHLTDQLTRTDDLVFHGIGRAPAIYDTIPESILLFYHRFLRKTVDEIISIELKNSDWFYEYDFLLVPEHSQRPRISKMFLLEDFHQYLLDNEVCQRKWQPPCDYCTQRKIFCRRYMWPEKQVYLVEFQFSLLYDPPGFLFPIVHECFHYYGDTFRLREKRAEYFAVLIAIEILYELDMEKEWYNDLKWELLNYIEIDEPIGLNLSRTKNQIYDKLKNLFTKEKLTEIKKGLEDPFYLEGNEIVFKWLDLRIKEEVEESKQEKWGRILEKWEFYFRECFADLMALLFFDFPLVKYLSFVNDEWNNSGRDLNEETDDKSWQIIQRVALVISAFTLEDRSLKRIEDQYTEQELKETVLFKSLNEQNSSCFVGHNKLRIQNVIISLFAAETQQSFEENCNDPPAKLKLILDYLFKVKTRFYEVYEKAIENKDSGISILRREYDVFFVKGEMFERDFYSFLRDADVKE